MEHEGGLIMTDLVEQGQRADHQPQIERVMGQDLVYPDVGTCVTVTHARTGPPQPYLVGVHLGMFEHDDTPIRPETVAYAIDRLKNLLEPRTVRLTKRRPHATFIIGWISMWEATVPDRYNELYAYVQTWKRSGSGGTQIVTYDLAKLDGPPNTATITFQNATYLINIVGTHSTRNADTDIWTHTPVNKTGSWDPNNAVLH